MNRGRSEPRGGAGRVGLVRRLGLIGLVALSGITASGCFAWPAPPPAPAFAPAPAFVPAPAPAPAPAPPPVVAAPAVAAPVVAATGISANQVGFSTSGMLLWESDAQLNADFDAIAATGARWIRVPFDWNSAQPDGPDLLKSQWSYEDRVVKAARSRGLQVLGLAAYTPPWARQSQAACPVKTQYCPPERPSDYAAFVAAAAARYAPMGVHAWEIWNEPNWDPWWASADGPNAAAYVAMLQAAYPAIHRADPAATVVTGGLAPHGDLGANPNDPRHPVNFLKAMYAAGANGYFDAVGTHPYPPLPYAPLSGTIGWNALLYAQTLHDVMAANGDNLKQVWGTEWGAPTGTSSMAVSEASQASYMDAEYQQWATYAFAGPLFTHEIRDRSSDATTWSDNLGLEHLDGTPKPALTALRNLVAH
jgi:hypothetical protein